MTPTVRFPSTQEWMQHPDALDRFLDAMITVATRYALATPERRLRMCGANTALVPGK